MEKGEEWRLQQAEGAGSTEKSAKGTGVGVNFLGANLMGFFPERRVAKVHPAKTCCQTCVWV